MEKTQLNVNSFRDIETKLPIWLATTLKKQFTVANTIAKIVINYFFNEITEQDHIKLTAQSKDEFISIIYAGSRNLGHDLNTPLETKKFFMTALNDQPLFELNEQLPETSLKEQPLVEGKRETYQNKFGEMLEKCADEYKKSNINVDSLRKIPKENLHLLSRIVVSALPPQSRFTEQLAQGLIGELKNHLSLANIKPYEIYYLLGVYFANLASINGLGYHSDGVNTSFIRFRLYAAICLSQCVISAKNDLSEDQKIRMSDEIKNILFTSECMGQITNKLYGQYSNLASLAQAVQKILDTKMIA